MLNLIFTLAFALLKVLAVGAAAYLFYYRVWDYTRAYWFYRS